MAEWRDVAQVLLGSWPAQTASWGREALGAYLAELKGRGLEPDEAIIALRLVDRDWPPSVATVAACARVDPARPTFDEAWVLIYRALGRCAENKTLLQVLDTHHPCVRSFVERQGIKRLRMLEVDDPQWGEKHLADLRRAWDRQMEASECRQLARGDLRQLDPLAGLHDDGAQVLLE